MPKYVRVCQDWFPKGSYKGQKEDGFLMWDLLKLQLDILLKNITRDWDFTIVISGQGEVRVGKSFLASQIGCYWVYQLEKLYGIKVKWDIDNFVLTGKDLIKRGNWLGTHYKYSPLVYDEAGADLEGRKVMTSMTRDVLDYYRECGQYNMLNILVLPDFFDLPKGIALTRSIFLIDVYYIATEEGIFERGYFNFYSKRNKKKLYLNGKKELNYHVAPYDFNGQFPNVFTLNYEKYKKLKLEALKKRESLKRNKFQIQRDASWYLLAGEGLTCKKCGNEIKLTQEQLARRMENMTGIFVHQTTIGDALKRYGYEEQQKMEDKNKN